MKLHTLNVEFDGFLHQLARLFECGRGRHASSGFGRMMKLAMASLLSNLDPSIALDRRISYGH
jgi:hypothetical protein